MTTQEAYELMRVYLTRPGARQALHEDVGGCGYEMAFDDGEVHRCAVGCLLSVDAIDQLEARQLLFGTGVSEIIASSRAVQRDLDGIDPDFLGEAQLIHDGYWIGGRFNVRELDDLAFRYGLTPVAKEEPAREAVPA